MNEGGAPTTSSTVGIALNDVSGSVRDLKQALRYQLKGMVLQLECLRKCDDVLSVKCNAQARAAAALKVFSQVCNTGLSVLWGCLHCCPFRGFGLRMVRVEIACSPDEYVQL